MCCESMWQQWGPQREIMERGLQSMAQVEAVLKSIWHQVPGIKGLKDSNKRRKGGARSGWYRSMECDRNVDTWDCMRQRVIQGISSNETYVFMDHVVLYSLNGVFVYVVYQPPGPSVKASWYLQLLGTTSLKWPLRKQLYRGFSAPKEMSSWSNSSNKIENLEISDCQNFFCTLLN